jgi:hypothetical protein
LKTEVLNAKLFAEYHKCCVKNFPLPKQNRVPKGNEVESLLDKEEKEHMLAVKQVNV